LDNNPRIRISDLVAKIQHQVVREKRADELPNLNGNLTAVEANGKHLLIRFDSAWLRSRWAAPLELLGQNSLPVFCSGIVFGFAARLSLEYDDRAFMQVAINLLGAIAMLAVGALAAWYRTKGKARSPRAAPSASPALLPVNAQTDIG
jgi:hypothetical protein